MDDRLPFLSDDFHFAIAQVSVRSSQMEHLIESTIESVMSENKHVAEFLLRNVGQDRVVKALGAALLDAFPTEKDSVRLLTDEIVRVRSERNEILHLIWGKFDGTDKAVQVSFRPFRARQTKIKTASDVRQIATDMMSVSKSLIAWQERAFRERQDASQHRRASLTPPSSFPSPPNLGPPESGQSPAPPENSSQG